MAIGVTLMAKDRGGPSFAAQLLYHPVTDAGMDTDSYHEFAEGYFLTAPAMEWFWDQYLPDKDRRSESLASPLRASSEELSGLPPALVINGQADVLRDEGEAYAAKLRAAGVSVTATRYGGIIHDFVMLHPLCWDQRGPRCHSARRRLLAQGTAQRLNAAKLRATTTTRVSADRRRPLIRTLTRSRLTGLIGAKFGVR
jgi:acetyl esterase/lipase